MSQPLLATARIKFKYAVASLPHVLSHYCAFNLVLGVPQLVDRDGITTILWTLAAQRLWDLARPLWGAAGLPAPASVVLESRSGLNWNPLAFATLTGIGTGAAAFPGEQISLILRDTAFKKLRVLFLETGMGYYGHSQTPHGLGAPLDALEDEYTGVSADANATYRWVKSRGDRFLAGTGDFVGVTLADNDKLRRARHLT